MITIEDVTLAARDGRPLAGTIIRPEGEPRGGVLITAGTGFKRSFYRAFAEEGARRGLVVLTFDARGVGGSAPDDLAATQMHYTDWGRLDTPAALDCVADEAGRPVFHIGHSVGGHFAGLWDNPERCAGHAFVCVGSGYWGDHARWYRPMALWFWHGWGRYSLARYGYLRRGGGWTGAPLPSGVVEPWRRWCHRPGYYREDVENHHEGFRAGDFENVTAPIRSFVYTDDPIATERTAGVMLGFYPNAPSQTVLRAPSDYGLKPIGHAGPFPTASRAAWDEVWDWAETEAVR